MASYVSTFRIFLSILYTSSGIGAFSLFHLHSCASFFSVDRATTNIDLRDDVSSGNIFAHMYNFSKPSIFPSCLEVSSYFIHAQRNERAIFCALCIRANICWWM